MNIYYYLFYKLTSVLDKHGKNEFGPVVAITFFVGLNFGIVYISVFPVTEENFESGHKILLLAFIIILYIFNSILFLNKNRRQNIINKYKNESRPSRILGSLIVILYIGITLISIFLAN